MRTWLAVGAAVLAALPVGAQQQQQQQDPVESRVQRLRDQLRLTDEQLPKVREIVKKEMDDLKGVLTDEQKPRLEDGGRGRGGPGGGNNNPGGGFGNRGGWYPSTDELKTQLSLSDEQVTKINEVRDGVRQEMRNYFQNRGGRPPGQDFQAAMEKMRADSTAKIKEVLKDDQKAKFDEILKTFETQQQQGNNTPGGGNRGGRGNNVEDRVNRAMEVLKITDAKEAEAVRSVVKKVAEAMEKLDTAQREARTKFEEASRNTELSDEAVGDKLTEVRKGLKDLEKELAVARQELADIVTNRQELELLRRGILR
jgi:hypothetical protein